MIIKRIKIKNYKTYRDLELDLSVQGDKPIVLIGGGNGGGKTTLFEAITGALYGLKIEKRQQYFELLNNGLSSSETPDIMLEITFTGKVLNQEQKYIIRRNYRLMTESSICEVGENVMLNMNGSQFVYGPATVQRQRREMELQVNKIIKANLPQELSQYFLFDAMKTSDLLKDGVFARIIKDNIENVMGFDKYVRLQTAADTLLKEKSAERLKADNERKQYEELCAERQKKQAELDKNLEEQEQIGKYLIREKDNYEQAKNGQNTQRRINIEIEENRRRIAEIEQDAQNYTASLKKMVDDMEVNIFLPQLASQITTEVEQIMLTKQRLRQQSAETYKPEKIREIVGKLLDFLSKQGKLLGEMDGEVLVNHIIASQKTRQEDDPYILLDEEDVETLRDLVKRGGVNTFIELSQRKVTIEEKIKSLLELREQQNSLQLQIVGGDDELIRQYRAKEDALKQLKTVEANIRGEIAQLENRIHRIDVAIQKEPDLQYDTLIKLPSFFKDVTDKLLRRKKELIETQMREQLNSMLVSYKGYIDRVELSDNMENFRIRLFHSHGNEIALSQLNAASKQIFIQVLLKVLRNLGDYNPPVMIDTVMGVLDDESRDILMEEYFPSLAEQTILLCTTSEIRKDSDYKKLEPFVSKTYTLHRNAELQNTTVTEDYFGINLED